LEKEAHHDTSTRASDKHGTNGTKVGFFIHTVLVVTLKKDVRDAQTDNGDNNIEKAANERSLTTN